jgi:hypothetical protein
MSNLALTYSIKGRWMETEKLGVQVLETPMRNIGLDHPDTFTSMSNLGSTYQDQCPSNEAEELQGSDKHTQACTWIRASRYSD